MRSPIIGTEARHHSSSKKGYRSDGLHNLRQEGRATRGMLTMRIQSPQPHRRTSTAAQRSRAIPSAIKDRIRSSQHRAQHWNQHRSFRFHDGNRTAPNPSLMGKHDPLRSQTDTAGLDHERANDRRRSLGNGHLPPNTSGLVNPTDMGSRLRPRNPNHPCQRKGSCKALLRAAPADPMSNR